MLSVNYKIEQKDGKLVDAMIVNHKYSPKFKCDFILYTTLDNTTRCLVPLKKDGKEYYADYSYTEEQLEEMNKGFSIPAIGKLGLIIKAFGIEQLEENTDEFELPLTQEEAEEEREKEKQRVIAQEEVQLSEKEKIIFVRLNDELHMIYRVKSEDSKNYNCERIQESDFERNEDTEVIECTFSTPNYYKLEGASNIATLNKLPTKIEKQLVINDNEEIHVMIAKYLDKCYAYFIIKNEKKDYYEIEPSTYDFVKHRKYDLVIKNIQTEEEYKKFLDKYRVAYRNNTTMRMYKNLEKADEEKLSADYTRQLNLSEENNEKVIEFDYDEDEEIKRKAV